MSRQVRYGRQDMTLDSYINELKGRRIAVLGIGVSNRPLLRLLL